MTKVKSVFKVGEIGHVFAHQTAEHGRCNNNIFFNGDTIYSYGTHFPIAKHVTNKKKEKALLFTTRSYSNTTAKHIAVVRSACSHLNFIYCFNPNSEHNENIESFHVMMKNQLNGLNKAKKPEKYIEPAKDTLNDLKKYCEFFSLKVPAKSIELIESAENGGYKEYLEKEAKRIEAQEKAAKKREQKKFQETLKNWREGKSDRLYSRFFDRDYLRYNGKRIETSQGVEIPLEVGKKAFAFITSTISNGGCNDCEYKILGYRVGSVTKEMLRIGCHNIDISEINNVAKQLNWIKP